MLHIEIWRAKPKWHQSLPEERTRTVEALKRLVSEPGAQRNEEYGPLLYCNARECLLIWNVPSERAEPLRIEYKKFLTDYFEPLMYGSAGEFTAKDYMNVFQRVLAS